MSSYPTRYCSQCDKDWPAYNTYNLCPKCGRNTVAQSVETFAERPDERACAALAATYRSFNEYCARLEGEKAARPPATDDVMKPFEAALAATKSIPSAPNPGGRLAPKSSPGKFPDNAIPDQEYDDA